MFNGIIFYSIVIISAAILYRWLFQGKTDPSISRRIIWDILWVSLFLIPVNICFQRHISLSVLRIHIPNLLITIYIIGVVVLSFVFIFNFLRLLNIKRHSEKCKVCDVNCLLHTDSQLGCFSWLNNIYLPKNFKRWSEKEIKMILSHENAHIHYGHWLDLKMIQIFCIFQWYNPAIWYFKKELQRVHECEADFHVIKETKTNKKSYEYFLLKVGTSETLVGNVHKFNSQSLRHRIIMMNHKNLKKDWVERGSIIFVLSIMISIFF